MNKLQISPEFRHCLTRKGQPPTQTGALAGRDEGPKEVGSHFLRNPRPRIFDEYRHILAFVFGADEDVNALWHGLRSI